MGCFVTLPQFVTFTGIDNKTDLDRVKDLSARYPIEWGILFGGKLGGNRYPSNETVDEILTGAIFNKLRLSAHLCGKFARAAVNYKDGELFESIQDVASFSKFQINAVQYDMAAVIRFQQKANRPVIIQVRGKTFPEPVEGVTYLHDQSGGKGKVPTSRPAQRPDMPLVGYAGGIGPVNVTEILSQIEGHNFSLDMESNIRTDDWLDLDKCAQVCQQIWGEGISVRIT